MVPLKSTSTQHYSSVPRGALKLKEAAEYLGGLNPETVRRLVRRGLLKPNRATRHLLFAVSELNRFLTEAAK